MGKFCEHFYNFKKYLLVWSFNFLDDFQSKNQTLTGRLCFKINCSHYSRLGLGHTIVEETPAGITVKCWVEGKCNVSRVASRVLKRIKKVAHVALRLEMNS